MKLYPVFYLILLTVLVSSFQPNERAGMVFCGYNDSLINGKAKFIKHVQGPCCCYVWRKETNRFEFTTFNNGIPEKKLIDVEYDVCQPKNFVIGHYYLLVAERIFKSNLYRNISTSFTPLDSVMKRINEKFKTLDSGSSRLSVRE